MNFSLPFAIKKSYLPIDIFSLIFYLVSRYEEYITSEHDKHGRFTAKQSIAYKNEFLDKPIIEIIIKELKEILEVKYPEINITPTSYKFIPTYDIDIAYSYLHKGVLRNLGGGLKSILNFKFKDLKERIYVLNKKLKDPYDTHCGDRTAYDKSISTSKKAYQKLINKIYQSQDVETKIGIHPSYYSHEKMGKLKQEINRLSNIVGEPVINSRQHFLKLSFPLTYRNLIKEGVKNDFTMGYASVSGYRAGTSVSFYFYDLRAEQKTELLIHPFAIMDGSLKDYMCLTPEEAIKKITLMIDDLKEFGGTFISLWHNESLSDKKKWSRWLNVYEQLIKYAIINVIMR